MRLPAFLGLIMIAASPATTQETFDAQARITEALNAVRPIAMNRDQVDWTAVETRARDIASHARDTVDLLPAFHLIVWSLHDEHSFMKPTPAQLEEWLKRTNGSRYLPDTPRPRASVSAFKGRPVSGRDLALGGGGRATAVVVPGYSGVDADNSFARSIAEAIEARPAACGYVVDLRGNTGGNMGPMLAGLSPLLGEGFAIPAIAGPGMFDAVIKVEGDHLMGYPTPDASEGMPMGTIPGGAPPPALAGAPVAVLIDQVTGSSGEAIAVAFRGRGHTRFFGEKTFGIASGNQDVPLQDGVTLFVTIGLLKDSAGRTYPDGILPDEPVGAGPGDPDDPDDAVVEAAKAWLSTQERCRV